MDRWLLLMRGHPPPVAIVAAMRTELMHLAGVNRRGRSGDAAVRRRAHAARGIVAPVVAGATMMIALVDVASAGTVSTPFGELGKIAIIEYQAAAGERNNVRVTRTAVDPYAVTVFDAGATVTEASPLCVLIDVHTVQCQPFSVPVLRFDLGDRDDTLTADVAGMVVDAGVGDDLIDARDVGGSWLDGGGGRDHLIGGYGDDLLTDGDRDDTSGLGGAGPDILEGGVGIDHVSYRQRTEPVSVTLADASTDGERGEGDIIRHIEGVAGGSGDDRLVGDKHPNGLDGGRGRDTLIGSGGPDLFGYNVGGESSHWSPAAGSLDIGPEKQARRITAAGDRIRCGSRIDYVIGRRPDDYTPPTCEWIMARRRLPFKQLGSRLHDMALPAYPTLRRRALTYPVACSYEEDWDDKRWARLKCSGTVQLRERYGRRRLIAAGTIPRGRGTLTTPLNLTSIGRRLAAGPDGVRVTLRIRGQHLPSDAWLIRLTVP